MEYFCAVALLSPLQAMQNYTVCMLQIHISLLIPSCSCLGVCEVRCLNSRPLCHCQLLAIMPQGQRLNAPCHLLSLCLFLSPRPIVLPEQKFPLLPSCLISVSSSILRVLLETSGLSTALGSSEVGRSRKTSVFDSCHLFDSSMCETSHA